MRMFDKFVWSIELGKGTKWGEKKQNNGKLKFRLLISAKRLNLIKVKKKKESKSHVHWITWVYWCVCFVERKEISELETKTITSRFSVRIFIVLAQAFKTTWNSLLLLFFSVNSGDFRPAFIPSFVRFRCNLVELRVCVYTNDQLECQLTH